MKQSKQPSSREQRNQTARQRRNVILVEAGFAPVRFAVSIRHMPVFCSGWQPSTDKAPAPEGCTGHSFILTSHEPLLHAHEKPSATADEPAGTRIPGLSRCMVRMHAERLFRDVFPEKPLTEREWRLVEEDLARKLERDGL